jgi:hypothetical protein
MGKITLTKGESILLDDSDFQELSKYRGVSWDKIRLRWKAQIAVNNRNRFIGR